MSRASLLNLNEPAFAWEHAMSHRNALGVMAPLDRFSAVPYFVDPMLDTNVSAGNWHLNHQQSHDDALANFPQYYSSPNLGLRFGQNLVDTDLSNAGQATWWTFLNHMEHYVAGDSVSLRPLPPPFPQWTWPFW